MSNIVFMPVCSRCGTVLYGREIDCSRLGDENSIGGPVTPSNCPMCETWFNRIVIPTKLPWEAPKPPDYPSYFYDKELIDI
jgi:hypothetical protein